MHTVWTLEGPDAMTSGVELVAALESTDPDSALSTLVGRDVDEAAQKRLTDPRFGLASALYCGRPAGARRVLNPETGEEVAP